jgi:hypothetical protein
VYTYPGLVNGGGSVVLGDVLVDGSWGNYAG